MVLDGGGGCGDGVSRVEWSVSGGGGGRMTVGVGFPAALSVEVVESS